MNKSTIEESIRTSLKAHVSLYIVDDTAYNEALKAIDTLNIDTTVNKVIQYLDKTVGCETLNEINEFLASSRYLEYLTSVNMASSLIAQDIKTYVEWLSPVPEQSKMN